jgi:hypothetical protein
MQYHFIGHEDGKTIFHQSFDDLIGRTVGLLCDFNDPVVLDQDIAPAWLFTASIVNHPVSE